jgi:hypothetical protein
LHPAAALIALMLAASCSSDVRRDPARAASDSAASDSIARARQDSVNRAQPGYVVDSILTPEEGLRRFRDNAPGDSATRFSGGSASRRELVRRFVRAIAANDTSQLRAMAVHAREFSDVYYQASPYARPPYRQPVAFAWRMIQDPSTAGLGKLLNRFGGQPMRFVGERCDPKPLHEGDVTRYAGCLVEVTVANGKPVTKRYYGSIVEYRGQFKFLSYTNDF